jgi:hypothetical protein
MSLHIPPVYNGLFFQIAYTATAYFSLPIISKKYAKIYSENTGFEQSVYLSSWVHNIYILIPTLTIISLICVFKFNSEGSKTLTVGSTIVIQLALSAVYVIRILS